jgi:hypothetical protein
MILLSVLGAQLALAAALTFSGADYSAYQSDQPLLAFDAEAVDAIEIGESGGNSVEIVRRDGKWLIPAMADFPASETLAAEFLGKLAALEKGWPVATTSEAAARFKLTEESHERRVVLKAGGQEVGELMIGTSPAFRKAHVRLADQSEIYNVELAAHDAGTRGEEWMDRDYLDIDTSKMTSIEMGDVKIEKEDGALTVGGLKEGDTIKNAELSGFIHAVANPSFDVVQGRGEDALAKVQPADFTVKVGIEGGEPETYSFKKEGGAYLFASSAHPFVFRVGEARIKMLAEASRDKLVEAKVEEKKPEPEPAADADNKETAPEAATAPVAQPQPDAAATATGG